MSKTLAGAIAFAAKAHKGQLRSDGSPYIMHPIRVVAALSGFDDAHTITAILHDIVEDTEVTLDEIRREFGLIIRDAVDAITKRKGELYEESIERVCLNEIAKMVKIYDIQDNLSDISSARFSLERKIKLSSRYLAALERLQV